MRGSVKGDIGADMRDELRRFLEIGAARVNAK